MHIDTLKSRAIEGGGHLNLAVDALLPQNSHARTGVPDDSRCHILFRVIGQGKGHARVAGVGHVLEFLAGTLGIVAHGLQAIGQFRPGFGELGHRVAYGYLAPNADLDTRRNVSGADHGCAKPRRELTDAVTLKHSHHAVTVCGSNLNDRPQLFGIEHSQRVGGVGGHINRKPNPTPDGHLNQRRDQSAVRTVMIGLEQPLLDQGLDGAEETNQGFRLIKIRDLASHLLIHLGQG